jgi:hypothetical protein
MQASNEKIKTVLQYGYDFQTGEYFSNGWEIFKKGFWSFAGFTVVFLSIQFGLALIPLIGAIGSFLLSAPLSAGYYLLADRIARRESTEFNTFFKGFDYFGPLVIQSMIQTLMLFILGGPFLFLAVFAYFRQENLLDTDFGLEMLDSNLFVSPMFWTIIFLIPLIYLSIAWRWAPLLIIFYSMRPLQALETSRKLITRKWFLFLVFYLITGILIMSGVLLFFVGILFTVSFLYCADYAAFAHITQLGQEAEEDVSEHLVV